MRSLADVANRPARLHDRFAEMNSAELLSHFRLRTNPRFFPGFSDASTGQVFQQQFGDASRDLIDGANRICDYHSWPLLGFGEKSFGDQIEWCRDPISGFVHTLTYHRDVQLIRDDGSDARVLWELNRLGHLITLGQAYSITHDEKFTKEFLSQVRSWSEQNPYGLGPNWHCAMEVALRAMNLLVTLELFRTSPQITEQTFTQLLALMDQHGTYIRNNLEFSYIATSNHYFSDVTGLLWLGIMLPELRDASEWRQFGFREMLREMDKQVLPDGADFESSTGYHRFALELFLYSFILCQQNDVDVEPRYWTKLRAMLDYVRCYLRPDGLAPLIGDTDSGQVFPVWQRRSDEHAHVLAIGAVFFKDANLVTPNLKVAPELHWFLGDAGVNNFRNLSGNEVDSKSFPHAGTYVMRKGDRYLCFNASGAGINGRGSHGHNDSLSFEVYAAGVPFIVDPGTHVYTADLHQRHLFRSTAYHSTVKIDGEEQNTTLESMPFVIGDEAHPRVLEWKTGDMEDKVVAEHSGYARLQAPVVHRRTIVFDKVEGSWLIEDEFLGEGEHDYEVRFHFAPELDVKLLESAVTATNGMAALTVSALDPGELFLEVQSTSRDYGEKRDSITACWRVSGRPGKLRWLLRPHMISDQ